MKERIHKNCNSARWCLKEKHGAFDCYNFNIDTQYKLVAKGEKDPICLSPFPKYMLYLLHGSEVRVNLNNVFCHTLFQ